MGTTTEHSFLCAYTVFVWFLTQGSSLFIPTHGKLMPKDPHVWIGDTLVLTCVITDSSVTENWRHLYFTRNGTRIPDRYITKNASQAVTLRLPDTQIKDETTYYCRVNSSTGPLIVGKQRIHVYRRPVEVKSFECVVHNWAWMKCTWDLGVQYHHPELVNVSLYWVIEVKGNRQSDCPTEHFTNTSCEWKENDGKNSFKPDMTYKMVVEVMNTVMGHSAGRTKVFTIDTRKIVKPAKARELVAQIRSRNTTCLTVKWRNSKKHYTKTCEVNLTSKWNLVEKSWDTTEELVQMVDLCGLYPSAQYRITVRCRPRDYDKFFSDIAEITTTMPEDVPSAAPVLTPGSYRETPCAKQNCRIVTVYWKPVPEKERNGVITAYHISVNGTDVNVKVTNVISNQGEVTLDTDKHYVVRVRASTKVGLSPNVSTLLIQSSSRKPGTPEGFYVKGNGTDRRIVEIFWDKPTVNAESVETYTIYYCQAWKGNKTCRGKDASVDGDLQWVSVPASHTNHSLVLPAVSDDYLFGISADTPKYSSGLIWSMCTYLHNRVPTKSPKSFRFDDEKGDLSLKVRWDRYTCEESGPVLYYNLTYCQQERLIMGKNCLGNTIMIKKGKTEYTLVDLKDQKRYFVSLQAVTEAGLGPATPWINATAVKTGFQMGKGQMIGIAISAIIFLCFALLGLIVCGRRLTKTLLDPPQESIIIPPPLPDPDQFDSYTDIPDYQSAGPSPAVSPTSRTSLLSNGNSTVASTGSDSTGMTDDSCQVFILQRPGNPYLPRGSTKSVDKLGRGSDKKKKKGKKNLPPQGYVKFDTKGDSKSSGSLANGSALTLPSELLRAVPNSSDKDAVVMFTMGKAGPGILEPPVLHSGVSGHNNLLQVPPSQYQQNVMQHVSAKAGGNLKAGSFVSGQEGGSDQILPYIKASDVPNNCVGSAVSLASSGGVQRHTPPLELCSSRDRDLSDYGGYEEPITGPLSASTPIATFPHIQSLERGCGNRDICLDQSYVQRPKLTIDSRSLPSILECGGSHRRNSLEDSDVDSSTLSIGTSNVSVGSVNNQTCTSAVVAGSNGYVAHPNGAPAINVNGYVPVPQCPSPVSKLTMVDGYLRRPDMTSSETNGHGNSLTPVLNGTPKADLSKASCLSVVRPISNYMKDLPAQYFLDPQAFDDLPTTEL
ncbi:uncharacterized protein LOC135471182 isoform X2 [Liolophura sinensis]|uniref:uncharacterized protein LOC135471182 isoform X2 n=1 Tax=Liolophura sinensis TaxID=3198878 RepID=UPI00315933B1